MATYTTHYNLKKPALADKIRIADFNGNADTIDATMYENATLGAQLKAAIGIVENTNTATHNISEGNFVIWKGVLKVASSAISTGATLSDANLSSVPNGGLNALNGNLNDVAERDALYAPDRDRLTNALLIDNPTEKNHWNRPYRVSGTYGTTNMPSDCQYGVRVVFPASDGYCNIFIIGVDSNDQAGMWVNALANNSWTGWKKL